MKKIINLILVLALCLSLCACGASSQGTNDPAQAAVNSESSSAASADSETTETPTETVDETIYTFGDTVSTGMFEFTPVFEGFADEVGNWPDENFLTPDGKAAATNPFKAGPEKVMMYFSGYVKNIGDSKSNEKFLLDFAVDYADGYIFEFNDVLGAGWGEKYNDEWFTASYDGILFEPLSSVKDRDIRFCIEVPEQLETDIQNILIIFKLDGNEYKFRLE